MKKCQSLYQVLLTGNHVFDVATVVTCGWYDTMELWELFCNSCDKNLGGCEIFILQSELC